MEGRVVKLQSSTNLLTKWWLPVAPSDPWQAAWLHYQIKLNTCIFFHCANISEPYPELFFVAADSEQTHLGSIPPRMCKQNSTDSDRSECNMTEPFPGQTASGQVIPVTNNSRKLCQMQIIKLISYKSNLDTFCTKMEECAPETPIIKNLTFTEEYFKGKWIRKSSNFFYSFLNENNNPNPSYKKYTGRDKRTSDKHGCIQRCLKQQPEWVINQDL